ncbi:uncharacterized protein LOC110232587 [Exaiptasia diaphana]|uniref:Uncharacterized protein n=1 Tax=Exaiptasia diaphana TaxID=2652724 RepID=A0A913WSK1_EXADI|nr:uncharacterized protein LOC110232587 [Exaiptasia diaphana]KXJ18312.1 hypothetical protein AC249_AIPGENE18102 [Exaiptasia diaphana]
MLKTKNDQEFVLEFMSDGKVHLYKAEYGLDKERVPDVTDVIRMRDEMGMEWSWIMQRHGQIVPKNNQVTPNEARKQVQRRVGRDYDIIRTDPHNAQEEMRKYFGVEVKNDYLAEGYDKVDDEDEEDDLQ